MDSPYAAIPGDRQRLAEEFRAQPTAEQPAGCPMCRKADQLFIDVPIVKHYRINAYRYEGISQPEFDLEDELGVTEPPRLEPSKITCQACHWSFTGKSPLSKLVAL